MCWTENRLVNGANPIPDSGITASSYFGDFMPHFARINSATNWCASDADTSAFVLNFFIQVSHCFVHFYLIDSTFEFDYIA